MYAIIDQSKAKVPHKATHDTTNMNTCDITVSDE